MMSSNAEIFGSIKTQPFNHYHNVDIEFDESISFGIDFRIKEYDLFRFDLGISHLIHSLEKDNKSITFNNSDIINKPTKVNINTLFGKFLILMENDLSLWVMLGLNEAKSDYLQFEENINNCYNLTICDIGVYPISDLKFNRGQTYGIGLDVKADNGMFAGFNFTYDIFDFNGKVKINEHNEYLHISSEIKLTRRSIRLGFEF